MKIGITLGDPAGIGPELVLRLLRKYADDDIVVYGNREILERVADNIKGNWSFAPGMGNRGTVELMDFTFPEASTIVPGKVQAACGRIADAWLRAAADDAIKGHIDAIVTGPINKAAMGEAELEFVHGQTEILTEFCREAHAQGSLTAPVGEPCMMFCSSKMIIGLATIHEALADVPKLITKERVLRTIRLVSKATEKLIGREARIGVLALNPHAGENGLFGREEIEAIAPAINEARAAGLSVYGPIVPDVAFRHQPFDYDAYVVMYHDQGLIPFKLLSFDTGVNVTVGLPLIRTSPDHGTAFDLAWQGRAEPTSFFAAYELAKQLVS